MITIFEIYLRKKGRSKEEFFDYLINVHAPIVATIRGLQGYLVEQPHFLPHWPDNSERDLLPELDGIGEYWLEDVAAYHTMLESSEGQAWISDKLKFVGAIKRLVTQDGSLPVVPGSQQPVGKGNSQNEMGLCTIEEFRHRWHHCHGSTDQGTRFFPGVALAELLGTLPIEGIPEIASDTISSLAQSYLDSPEGWANMVKRSVYKAPSPRGAVASCFVQTFGIKESVFLPPQA